MAVTISQFLLVFETLAVIKNIAQVFGRMSLDSDLSDVFLKIRLGLWIWGRTPGKKKSIFITLDRESTTVDLGA